MATSMGVTIGLGVWLGMKLDEHWSLETPWATITGALLGVTIATYRVIQSLTKL
jgi:F0F1-type ATP synthase assembly protein I